MFAENYETLVKIATFMALIGMPTILGLVAWFLRIAHKLLKDVMFISSAIKSQIRNELIKDFDVYQQRTWCSTVEQTEWINRYNNYHNLYGENGVLDNKYKIITNMPNAPQNTSQGGC